MCVHVQQSTYTVLYLAKTKDTSYDVAKVRDIKKGTCYQQVTLSIHGKSGTKMTSEAQFAHNPPNQNQGWVRMTHIGCSFFAGLETATGPLVKTSAAAFSSASLNDTSSQSLYGTRSKSRE